MSKKWIFTILIIFVVLLGASQFIRSSRKVPAPVEGTTFTDLASPPYEVAAFLKTDCYDCHSYETKYPWHANVAPISWWIDHHVKEGRKHLNFSTWGAYTFGQQAKKAQKAAEAILEGHMPITPYTWMHRNARLNDAERKYLADYFESLRQSLNAVPDMPMIPNEAPPR